MRRPFSARRAAAMLALGMATTIIATAAPASASGTTHTVHPGESIQAAIDAAQPGDKIKVKAGTYHENVYVNKDFIELEGDGADETSLLPPDVGAPNPCVQPDGTIFGAVCVGFDETHPVKGFELEDMKIEGFANGAFLVNTSGAEVDHMVFANNHVYGLFYNSSTGGDVHDTVAYGSEEAGLYFGDAPNADVKVEDNEVYDNGFGMLLRDASNGRVEDNHAHDNCFGILVLNTGEPGDAARWKLEDNKVEHNTKSCPPSDEAPPTSGAGIVLAGATKTVVDDNTVNDNAPSGASPLAAGGIVLASTIQFGGTPASDNRITENRLEGNQPYDISDDGAGTGNHFDDNRCDTSKPAGLCGDDNGHRDNGHHDNGHHDNGDNGDRDSRV
jgi:parallel beta-helix repeat protein